MQIDLESLFVQQSYTDKGNRYNKSRAAKILITSASITNQIYEKLKSSDCVYSKETKFFNTTTLFFANVLMAFGAGSIIDDVINKINADYIDKSVFLGKLRERLETHQG